MTGKKPEQEFRMSETEFDRIMRQALQVKPQDGKPKKRPKPKAKKSGTR